MIAAYYSAAVHLAHVVAHLPKSELTVRTNAWDLFESAVFEAQIALLFLPEFSHSLFERLRAFRRRHAHHPVVVATRRSDENLDRLKLAGAHDVVWWVELERDLWPVVSRTRARLPLQRLASEIEHATTLPRALRYALAHGCRRACPPRSVKELAKEVNCPRSTLGYQWQRMTIGKHASERLEDFVDWLILLGALWRKTPNTTWHRVAESLGVHEHTLMRTGRRLTGCSLSTLSQDGYTPIAERYRKKMLAIVTAATFGEQVRGF